jgi:hypothetical protein
MRWRKRIRINSEGVRLAADVDAAISVNRAKSGATTESRSVSHVRVVQDSRGSRAGSHGEKPSENEQEDQDD